MSQRVIWTTGQRKWCSAWCRDFIASTGLLPLSSPITLSLPAAVTAYCDCIRAWPRKCRPFRSISAGAKGQFQVFLPIWQVAGFVRRSSGAPRDGGRWQDRKASFWAGRGSQPERERDVSGRGDWEHLGEGNMFERYTEKARRVIFFARYEASQFGSPYIETEHLLLGLLREDKALTNRFLRSHASVESIRKQIEGHTTIREKVSTSVDLPLSNECKRVLAYAAEEAERLSHKHIGTEHLLLGLLREEKCFAAEILHERGLRLSTIREELARSSQEKAQPQRQRESSLLSEFSRDLTQAAMDNQLDPLVGRESELERVVQILCRRTKNNPVLIGEPGVGKTAIVEGLAQRIADGNVPSFLADKRILALDLSLIVAGTKYRGQFEERLKTIMKELMESQNCVIFIDELHTLVGAGSAEGSLDAANILKPALSRGEIQCIGATTPAEYRKSIEKDRSLERRFQAVKVPPPDEKD